MADEHSQRPYRSSESIARAGQGKASGSASGTDPLAELARLIGQSDPFGEFSRENARRAAEQPTPQAGRAPVHAAPSVSLPQTFAGQDYQDYYAAQPQQQAYEQQDYDPAVYAQHDAYVPGAVPGYPAPGAYDPNNPPYSAQEQDFYDDVPPSKRRTSIMMIAGVLALATIGTAGAFGYRALFGSSGSGSPPPVIKADTAPSKVVPAASAKDAQSNKIITDRVGPQGEKLVSREEKPVGNVPVGPDGATGSAGDEPGPLSSAPKKIRTIAITPDQQGNPVVADAAPASTANAPLALMPEQPMRQVQTQRIANAPQVAAEPLAVRPQPARPAPQPPAAAPAPSNAPLSLNPNAAPARPQAATRTAAVAPTQTAPRGRAYAVQLASHPTEAEAEAAFRTLLGKYRAQLEGRPHFINRVDLGAKGTYYRVLIGPYANGGEATELCTSLKAAGASCFIQRN